MGTTSGMSLHGRAVTLRPLDAADAARLREIRGQPEVERWWHELEDDFPGTDEPDSVRFAVVAAGEIVGMVQYAEENEPAYRHAGIDVFLDPSVHGRGLGLDTVLTIAVHLVRDRGHHRLTIDPAADNTAAIACYAAAGFRPVGVMRQYERDDDQGWHDGLLMDALADEVLTAAERRGHVPAAARRGHVSTAEPVAVHRPTGIGWPE